MLSDLPKYDPCLCGLPGNYWNLSETKRRYAREEVLRAWFDPDRLEIFCTDVEKLVTAMKLWHTHYMRYARCNRGIYTLPNPEHKYTIIRNAFLPPKEPGLSGKSITHAPRGTGKTITLIYEFVPMATIIRPATEIVVSEINKPKTRDQLERIRANIEENDLIQADFGGKGELWGVTGMRRSWNSEKLQFGHDPQSRIVGISACAAVRGAHPIVAILDDPEDKEDSKSGAFADKFFNWLTFDYLPIVQPGGFFNWVTTINDEQSCANVVIRGVRVGSDEDEDRLQDDRFSGFSKTVIEQYTRDNETGEWSSCWEALRPVSAMASLQRSMGSAFDAELQGKPRPAGQAMFLRDDFAHGWALAADKDGNRFMLDLYTGECVPWDDFLESMIIFGGLDLADSQASHAQPGAGVYYGIRNGIMYVLDAYIRKVQCLQLVEHVLLMGVDWNASVLAVDTTAMQVAILPVSKSIRTKLRDEGKVCPRLEPCNAAGLNNKVSRIESALASKFRDHTIRFPWVHPQDHQGIEVALAANKLATLLPITRRGDMVALIDEVDRITDNSKPKGWNGLDALEMPIRKMGGATGNIVPEKRHRNAKVIDLAKTLGLHLQPRVMTDGRLTPGFADEDYRPLVGDRILQADEGTDKIPDYYSVDPYG